MRLSLAKSLLSSAFIASLALVPFKAVAEDNRPIVGIGEIISSIQGADPNSFGSMLETQLTKTNKFRIIERSRLGEILKEKGLGAAGITNGDKSISGVQGVDYLIYGTITKCGKAAQGGSFAGFGGSGNQVQMAVDIRIVDAHTGDVKHAETVEEQANGGTTVNIGFLGTFGGQQGDPLADVQRLTAKAITALITTTVFPMKVVTVQADGTYILSYGDSVLTNGDKLIVYKLGESFVDPDTGKTLGAEETEIGRLEVTQATANFSKAKLVSGKVEKGNIARPAKH